MSAWEGPNHIIAACRPSRLAGRARLTIIHAHMTLVVCLPPADNGYCVAWTSGMEWNIAKAAKGLWNTVISGEGLVANFTGPGTVFVQTRSMQNLANALVPYLPKPSSGGDSSGIDINND